MTLLYNFESNRLENVQEAQVTDLIASGKYGARKGTVMPVVAPDGEVGTIPTENAQKAFLEGFRFHTTQENQANMQSRIAEIRAEEADQPAIAFGAGVARGATLGASDVLVRAAIGTGHALGLTSQTGEQVAESLGRIREASPIASGLGEVTGAIAGTALALPAAGVAGAGAAVTSRVAGSATVAKLAAKGTAGEIAAQILSKGAGSAIEGAFYGAGEVLSEAALGDPNLTASNAAMVFGSNVLLGGAVGGLIPGAATAIQKTKENIRKILVDDMNIPAKSMQAFGKLISFAKVSTPEQKAALKELAEPTAAGREFRERVIDLVENPDKASEAAINAVTELRDVGKFEASILGNVRETARDTLERVKYAKKSDKLAEVVPITSALKSTIKEASERSNRFVGGAGQDLSSVLEDLTTRAGKAENLADMHKSIHESRMMLDKLFENVRTVESYEAKNTVKLINRARSQMNEMLHSEKMFPGVGNRFAEIDDAFAGYLSTAKEFRKTFEKKVLERGGYRYDVKRGKASGLVKSPASDLAQEKQEVFDAMSNAVERMAEASGVAADDVATGLAQIKSNLDKVKSARAAAILLDRLEAKTGRVMMASLVGYAGGELAQEAGFTDMPGAGMAGMLGGALLANPKTVMTYLMRLERGNIAAAKAIEEASQKYLGGKVATEVAGALGQVQRARGMTINELARAMREDEEEPTDDVSAFKQSLVPYQSVTHTGEQVRSMHPLLDDIAPNTYASVVNKNQAAVEFIKSKLPADRDALFAGKVALSQTEKIRLDRYTRAAFYPGELLHEMSEGSVRPETVEAVKNVYPEMFDKIQRQLADAITEPSVQRKMPRRKTIELAKLLGVPTTESLQHIDMLQQSWEYGTDEQQPNRVRPKASAGFMAPTEGTLTRMAEV